MIKKNSPYEDIMADIEHAEAHDDDEVVKMAADIMRDLDEVRAIARVGVDIEHFRIGPLGGAWTLREQGVLFDAYKSWASGAEVCDWCDRYMLQKTARFNVSLYGNQGSINMAKQWMHRMHWCFEAWCDGGCLVPFVYDDELMALYNEPREFADFANALASPAAVGRVEQLRSIRPVGPGR